MAATFPLVLVDVTVKSSMVTLSASIIIPPCPEFEYSPQSIMVFPCPAPLRVTFSRRIVSFSFPVTSYVSSAILTVTSLSFSSALRAATASSSSVMLLTLTSPASICSPMLNVSELPFSPSEPSPFKPFEAPPS